jgi:FixJ family two-component response regulator
MSEPESIVLVVDDDPSVRTAIKRLIGCVGLQVELFGSAKEGSEQESE